MYGTTVFVYLHAKTEVEWCGISDSNTGQCFQNQSQRNPIIHYATLDGEEPELNFIVRSDITNCYNWKFGGDLR